MKDGKIDNKNKKLVRPIVLLLFKTIQYGKSKYLLNKNEVCSIK